MKLKTFLFIDLNILVSFYIIVGCSLIKMTPTSTPSITEKVTTSSPFVSVPITVIPTEDFPYQPSLTLTPSLMPVQTHQFFTPIPTIAPNKIDETLLKLQQSNNGCKLPCWWGISPGETTWDDAHRFLESLGANVLSLQPDNTLFGITINNSTERVGASISVDHQVVQSIAVNIHDDLVDILNIYGQPDEIWIFADAQSINQEAPYTIALYYGRIGFLATYDGTAKKEEILKICPNKISGVQSVWYLWNPKVNLTFEEAGKSALLFIEKPSERPFFRIEEVTNINVNNFFQSYRYGENATLCFQMEN